MTRAEIRRAEKEKKKAKTATYNFTEEQLNAVIREKIGDELERLKKEAAEEATNVVLALVLTLPLEVLMDHYWPKTYRKKLPGFIDHVLDYYEKWQNGDLDMDELKEDLWNYGGIRLEAESEDTSNE